jgi:hypothetical protein
VFSVRYEMNLCILFKGNSAFRRLSHNRPDLSSERAPQTDKTVTLRGRKIVVKCPRFGLDTKTY